MNTPWGSLRTAPSAEALKLGTCAIGSFNDAEVKELKQLPIEEEPPYIMPIGKY